MNLGNDIKEDDEFFREIKRTLGITWKDKDTDSNVRDYIRQGVEVLQNDVGTSIDFEKDDIARGLLKTYCRYARNNSEEYFIENNLKTILKLEVKYGKDKV